MRKMIESPAEKIKFAQDNNSENSLFLTNMFIDGPFWEKWEKPLKYLEAESENPLK